MKGEKGGIPTWLSIPIIRHLFAKEYGWTYAEVDQMTLRQVGEAFTLIAEDKARGVHNNG